MGTVSDATRNTVRCTDNALRERASMHAMDDGGKAGVARGASTMVTRRD
jgi:hypothetical protein